MNLKALSVAVTLLGTISVRMQTSVSFQYTYTIITNSYYPNDEINGYYYKEKLIDCYEDLVFSHEEREYQDLIINNIDKFKFDDNCYPYYHNGSIVILIGDAQGLRINGHLRKNECDEGVIREKIYIFDLFK